MDLLAAYDSDASSSGSEGETDVLAEQPQKRPRYEPGTGQQQGAPAVTTFKLPSAEAALAGLVEHHGTPAVRQQKPAVAAAPQPVLIPLGNGKHLQLPPEPARIRIFPHVDGNYPTAVYISVEDSSQAQLQALTASLLAHCVAATAGPARNGSTSGTGAAAGVQLWPTFSFKKPSAASAAPAAAAAAPLLPDTPAAAEQQLPLHMSISRTLPIKRIQMESLQAALTKQLKPFKAFRVQLQGLLCLVNDADTRSFVGVRVASGEQQVVRLVEAVNRAFTTHGLQTFYEEPLPHVSLAWAPGNKAAQLQPWLEAFKHEPIELKVTQVVCQIARVRHVVWQR